MRGHKQDSSHVAIIRSCCGRTVGILDLIIESPWEKGVRRPGNVEVGLVCDEGLSRGCHPQFTGVPSKENLKDFGPSSLLRIMVTKYGKWTPDAYIGLKPLKVSDLEP